MAHFLGFLDSVESSPEYAAFQKSHNEAFLAHIFMMSNGPDSSTYQVGYYSPSIERMTTFELANTWIKVLPDLEVFHKPGAEILPLDRDAVTLDESQALSKAQEAQKRLYPGHLVTKHIVILQKLTIGQVFNITFITTAFKIINMKLDSQTGDLKKHHLDSLFAAIS